MLKLMHDRRSTRAYRPEPLQEAVIQQILEAGRFAPSGMNKQLNHFYVITDPNYLADLTALVSRKMENYRDKDFRYGAPVLVLVTNQKESTTCVQDASCAMENMMLAAFSLGVGSCWINQLRETCDVPEVRALLTEYGVPEDHIVVCSAAIGYIEKETPAKPRHEGLVSITE